MRSVWDVDINHSYRPDHHIKKTTLRVAGVLREATTRVHHRTTRKYRDAVVGSLSPRHGLITKLRQRLSRETVIGAFYFLQADNVRLGCFQPVDKLWQANRDRIDIPGRDFHELLRLVPREVIPDKKVIEPCPQDSTYERTGNRHPEPVITGSKDFATPSPHCREQSGSQIARGIDRVSRIETKRSPNRHDKQANEKRAEICSWRQIPRVCQRADDEKKNCGSDNLIDQPAREG